MYINNTHNICIYIYIYAYTYIHYNTYHSISGTSERRALASPARGSPRSIRRAKRAVTIFFKK